MASRSGFNRADGGRVYTSRFVHKIHPSDRDVGPDVVLIHRDLTDRRTLAAALRKQRILDAGDPIHDFRIEGDGKIVVFPDNPRGNPLTAKRRSIWWSIVLTPREARGLNEARGRLDSKRQARTALYNAWLAQYRPGRPSPTQSKRLAEAMGVAVDVLSEAEINAIMDRAQRASVGRRRSRWPSHWSHRP